MRSNPTESKSAYVRGISAKEYIPLVTDPELDVFLLFVGKGCDNCDKFFPVFDTAARLFNKSPNLVFAILDMSENEVPDESVYYYPAVRFYNTRTGKKLEYKEYSKDFDIQEVIQFIKNCATTELIEDHESMFKVGLESNVNIAHEDL